MGKRRFPIVALAVLIAMPIASQANAAGFFDDLARVFSGRPAPQPDFDPFGPPEKPRRAKPRPVATKPAAPAVKLDPTSDAYWHLHDPTLRKGDIVVTRAGVVVFEGRGTGAHRANDFTALGETKKLPKLQQQMLEKAAAAGRSHFTSDPPGPAPVTAAAGPSAETAVAPAQ